MRCWWLVLENEFQDQFPSPIKLNFYVKEPLLGCILIRHSRPQLEEIRQSKFHKFKIYKISKFNVLAKKAKEYTKMFGARRWGHWKEMGAHSCVGSVPLAFAVVGQQQPRGARRGSRTSCMRNSQWMPHSRRRPIMCTKWTTHSQTVGWSSPPRLPGHVSSYTLATSINYSLAHAHSPFAHYKYCMTTGQPKSLLPPLTPRNPYIRRRV
jgi:hypothetical protein